MTATASRPRLVAAWLVLPLLPVGSSPAPTSEPDAAVPGDDRCPGFVDVPGQGLSCREPDGLWRVLLSDGTFEFTHGPHPPIGPPPLPEPTPVSVPGSGGDSDGPVCGDPMTESVIHVVYAHPTDKPNDFGNKVDDIRDLVRDADARMGEAADDFGVTPHYKVICANGDIHVAQVQLPTRTDADSFGSIVGDLRTAGFDRPNRKYWVWYDDTVACDCSGQGSFRNDDTLRLDNILNSQGNYAIAYGVFDLTTWMQESGHNLGAVQDSAPNSSGNGHCNDGQDIMCYDDGGPTSDYNMFACIDLHKLWDCHVDDYFHPDPPSDNHLWDHWNLGSPYNRFFTFAPHCGLPEDPIVVQNGVGQNFNPVHGRNSCYFQVDVPAGMTRLHAREILDGDIDRDLFVRFGDLPTHRRFDCADIRIDASAECVLANPPAGPTYLEVYNFAGTDHAFRVNVTYSRHCGTPQTPQGLTNGLEITVIPPAGGWVNCWFTIDVPAGQTRFRVEGDTATGADRDLWVRRGAPPDSQFDCSDTSSSSAASCTLNNPAAGTYWIELDNRAQSTDTATLRATFANGNERPQIQLLECVLEPSEIGQQTDCTFRATDDNLGIFYTVDWGDGTPTTRVPSTGTVNSGVFRSASHTWTQGGTFTVTVTASDTWTPPLTSVPRTWTHRVNRAPAAPTVTCAPTTPEVDELVTCTATATDPDGDGFFLTVDWGDGARTRAPAVGTVPSGTTLSATHRYVGQGDFVLSASATDARGIVGTSVQRLLAVTEVIDHSPAAPIFVCLPTTVDLAEETTCDVRAADPDGNDVHYLIEWGDGSSTRLPDEGTVASGTMLSTGHAYTLYADYTVQALATDSNDNQGPRSSVPVKVEATNHAPEAPTVSCSPATLAPGASTICTANGTDVDLNDGIAYLFDWDDGSPSERVPAAGTVGSGVARNAPHRYPEPGDYTVSVTAVDSKGARGSAGTALVTVFPNTGPRAPRVGCNPLRVALGNGVTCNATAEDPEFDSLAYAFHWGDGTPPTRVPTLGTVDSASDRTGSHRYTAPGTYALTVIATDAHGALGFATALTITVSDTNQDPLLQVFDCFPSPGTPGQLVQCTLQATDDSGALHYTVDWGDGTTSRVPPSGLAVPGQPQVAGHVWKTVGTYTVRATATDAAAAPRTSAPATRAHAVQAAPPNEQPVMRSVWCDPDASAPDEVVTCSFRATDDSTGLTYAIDWGDGTPPATVPETGFATPGHTYRASHAWFLQRSFTVTATATDNAGAPITSDPLTTTQTVQNGGACPLHRTGFLPAGLAGEDVEGVSGKWEIAIPAGCKLRPFSLTGTVPTDDHNVCWYNGNVELACEERSGPERGKVPPGATRARIVYHTGAGGNYHLDVESA